MQHPYYQEPSIRRRATPSPIPNHDGQHWTQLPPSPSDLQSTWRPPAHGRHNEFPPRPSSPRTGAPFRSESWFPIPLTPKADGRQLPPPHSYLRSHSSSSRDTLDWNLTLCDNTYEKGSRLSLLRKIPPLPIKLTDKYPTGNLKLSLQKNSVHSKDREKLDLDICNRWTSSKWWLLLGSISVFLYGLAGIGCAVITWLQGESQPILQKAASQALTRSSMATRRRPPRHRSRHPRTHHHCIHHPCPYLSRRTRRHPPLLSSPTLRLRAPPLARPHLPARNRLRRVQALDLLSRPEAEPRVEPMVHSPRTARHPGRAWMLWVHKRAARSDSQQTMLRANTTSWV